jgi:hypothetical protein
LRAAANWTAESILRYFPLKNSLKDLNTMAKKSPDVKHDSKPSLGDHNEVEATANFPLHRLHLDQNNPRLGAQAGQFKRESDVLDAVVNVYGIDDVLSSLAVNGYFEAEPMVGVRLDKQDGHIRIAEGNRRLAACLILTGDPRAKNHEKRTREYQALQRQHNQPRVNEVPVRVHANTKGLLSYLGVRHIAASQPWDSYAKAAWVAKVLETSDLTLDDVTQMIGDQNGTVARSLEGYYFVHQLIEAAQFNPSDSMRPGRGSNPEYPFSWVYTALGYGPVREWLGLPDPGHGKTKSPIPKAKENLDDAGELLTFLFGNRSRKRRPAVSDSRQITELARAIADPESRRLLKRGKAVEEVAELLKPAKERVADGLLDAQEALQGVLRPLSQGEVPASEASDLFEPSKKVRSLAREVNNKIVEIMNSEGDK